MKDTYRIVLAGNPNCGKTSLYNQLTGARQHVGNYPGVTVERKSGSFKVGDVKIELIDLPGIYSLSSSSPEERVAYKELIAPGIDMIIDVVDSTILQRSLYLTAQMSELHIPMLVALNMSDDADSKGLKIDAEQLEAKFGVRAVRTVGTHKEGIRNLMDLLSEMLPELESYHTKSLDYGQEIENSLKKLTASIENLHIAEYAHVPARFFALKLLEGDASVKGDPAFASVLAEAEAMADQLSSGKNVTFMADHRHAVVGKACANVITGIKREETFSDKIDKIVTNKWLGLPIFLFIMYLTFQFWFVCTGPLTDLLMKVPDILAGWVNAVWPADQMVVLHDLLVDGVIGGVGAVLSFIPWILGLFLAIAILEDSGYMARAAFVMDGFMRLFGLHGKSFVPLIMGFGCSVPAILATRSIESQRDRTTTIMVLPLMSCSARIPIYALLISVFFAKNQALILFVMYLIGIVIALIAARILKNTLFKGGGEVYLMELPPYRVPSPKSVILHMWDRSREYLKKAGTIILAATVILFVCNKYPEKKVFDKDYEALTAATMKAKALTPKQLDALASTGKLTAEQMEALKKGEVPTEDMLGTFADCKKLEDSEQAVQVPVNKLAEDMKAQPAGKDTNNQTDVCNAKEGLTKEQQEGVDAMNALAEAIANLTNEKKQEEMAYSLSGRFGKLTAPIFAPLGFDWKISTATVGALAAKEVFVSQMGVLYSMGEADENNEGLQTTLRKQYTPLQGFCMMVFGLLSIPCLATLAVVRRELHSFKMAVLEGVGLFLLAYIVTLIVYQVGSLLEIGTTIVG